MDFERFIELIKKFFEKAGTKLLKNGEGYLVNKGTAYILVDENRGSYYLLEIAFRPDIPYVDSALEQLAVDRAHEDGVDTSTIKVLATLGKNILGYNEEPIDAGVISKLSQKSSIIVEDSLSDEMERYLEMLGIEFQKIPLKGVFTIFFFTSADTDSIVMYYEELVADDNYAAYREDDINEEDEYEEIEDTEEEYDEADEREELLTYPAQTFDEDTQEYRETLIKKSVLTPEDLPGRTEIERHMESTVNKPFNKDSSASFIIKDDYEYEEVIEPIPAKVPESVRQNLEELKSKIAEFKKNKQDAPDTVSVKKVAEKQPPKRGEASASEVIPTATQIAGVITDEQETEKIKSDIKRSREEKIMEMDAKRDEARKNFERIQQERASAAAQPRVAADSDTRDDEAAKASDSFRFGENADEESAYGKVYSVFHELCCAVIFLPTYILQRLTNNRIGAWVTYWLGGMCTLFGIYYYPLSLLGRPFYNRFATSGFAFERLSLSSGVGDIVQTTADVGALLMAFNSALLSFLHSPYYLKYILAIAFFIAAFPIFRTFGKRMIMFLILMFIIYMPILAIGNIAGQLVVTQFLSNGAAGAATGLVAIALITPLLCAIFAYKGTSYIKD